MTSMSSPSTLPISNPKTSNPTTINSGQSQPTITTNTPALRAFTARLYDSLRQAFSQRRPWYELVDRTAFARPDTIAEATTRVRRNFSYFRINYFTLLASVLAFSLVSHPFSLLTLLSLLAAWLFLYIFRSSDQPLVIYGRTFSNRETLGILILLTIVVIFLTSVGSLLISAILVGLAIVCAHGAFRVPEDLFLDDQDVGPGSGLFTFVGAASSAAAAAAASRV